jgi:hypothetical protein
VRRIEERKHRQQEQMGCETERARERRSNAAHVKPSLSRRMGSLRNRCSMKEHPSGCDDAYPT